MGTELRSDQTGKAGSSTGETLIEASELSAGYGHLAVLHDINLHVSAGEVVALAGPNGAGKTTLMLTLAGVVPAARGKVSLKGRRTTAPLHQRARGGMRLITEDRSVFTGLSVADNLRLAHKSLDGPLAIFPELRPLLGRRVGLLSGGEQQMLTLARALAGSANLLLADELSLGLAPLIVSRLLRAVRKAADHGMGVLLVEQHIRNALSVADRVYVMRHGRIVLSGTSDEMAGRLGEIESSYLS